MSSLVVTTGSELKDNRSFDLFKNYEDIDIFKNIFGLVNESWLVDRTQTVKTPFKNYLNKENQIPDFSKFKNLDLEESLITVTKELIALDQKIYFLWSGGIDSTAALTAFLVGGNIQNIIVVCNQDSIREYSNFYQNHIRGKFSLMASELFMQKIKNNTVDGIALSCEQGDCLYGQDFGLRSANVFGYTYLRKPANKDNIKKLFIAYGMTDKAASCWYDLYSSTFHLSPRPIETMYDFSWWATFNWRWQWAFEKVYLRSKDDFPLKTFFSSPLLQKWSVNHSQYDITKQSDFKIDLKKFIFNYTKDQEYFENKIKHPSATLYYAANYFVAIDSNRTRFDHNEFSIKNYYEPQNFISDWINSQ
jgi:hypothetical protein